MAMIWTLVMVLQVLAALGVIGLVLVQHGKGADMGAAFGSGTSGSLFGASGSANFLSRLTAVLAAVFFASTLALAFASHQKAPAGTGSVMDQPASEIPSAPAQPSSAPANPGSEGKADTSDAKQGGASGQTGEIPK